MSDNALMVYTDVSDLITQDSIACPLILMPDRIIEVLRSKYLITPIHYEGLLRKEPLELPEEGLREILCNAIVHRSYIGCRYANESFQ